MFFQCLNFGPSSQETPRFPGDGNSDFLFFCLFGGHRLLRACFEQCHMVVSIADDLGFLGPPPLSRPRDRTLSAPRHCLDA